MAARRQGNRVSGQQLEVLWELLNANKCLATAYNRSLQAKEYSERKWKEIALCLNSQGNGAEKDWRGWCKYWVDYKAKIKGRAAAVRLSHAMTGGGPSTARPLTDIEQKFLQILGEDLGQGIPGVQVIPAVVAEQLETDETDMPANTDSLASESILHSFNITNNIENIFNAEPVQEPEPQNTPPNPVPSARSRSSSRTATQSPPQAALPSSRTQRQRRRRREPPMSQEAARRALVRSSQLRAEAALRSSDTLEKMLDRITDFQNMISRFLNAAFPTAAEQVNSS